MGVGIKYGIICGILYCFWIMSEYMLGLHNEHFSIGRYTEIVGVLIPLILMYLAIREKRDESPAKASYSRLVKTGIISSTVAAGIIASFFLGYIHYINPEWQDKIISEETEMLMKGATMEDITAAADQFSFYTQDNTQFLIVFGMTFIFGCLMSLIYSFFFKRNKAH